MLIACCTGARIVRPPQRRRWLWLRWGSRIQQPCVANQHVVDSGATARTACRHRQGITRQPHAQVETWHLCICAFVRLCVCAFVDLCICTFVRLCIRTFVRLCVWDSTRKRHLQTQKKLCSKWSKITSITNKLHVTTVSPIAHRWSSIGQPLSVQPPPPQLRSTLHPGSQRMPTQQCPLETHCPWSFERRWRLQAFGLERKKERKWKWMAKCTNAQLSKCEVNTRCTNAQMHKCQNAQIRDAQMSKPFGGMRKVKSECEMWRPTAKQNAKRKIHARLHLGFWKWQKCKCTNAKISRCTLSKCQNAKCKMSKCEMQNVKIRNAQRSNCQNAKWICLK